MNVRIFVGSYATLWQPTLACMLLAVSRIKPCSPLARRYKKKEGRDFAPHADPGVESVRRIYAYYKEQRVPTIVMAASFRNIGEIRELAGCVFVSCVDSHFSVCHGCCSAVLLALILTSTLCFTAVTIDSASSVLSMPCEANLHHVVFCCDMGDWWGACAKVSAACAGATTSPSRRRSWASWPRARSRCRASSGPRWAAARARPSTCPPRRFDPVGLGEARFEGQQLC